MAGRLAGTTEFATDLELPGGYDDEFRPLLAGHRLRAYHATRLLPQEIDLICSQGLELLTPGLVERRLRLLGETGLVTVDELDELRANTVFALNEQANREHQVCLFLAEATFSDQAGLWRLLETWGGEAIFWGVENDSALIGRLRSTGQPAIVVAHLKGFEAGWRRHSVWPSLPKNFIATLLNLDNRGAEVFYRAPIPGNRIEDIWIPGHRDFERHLAWVAD